MNSSAQRLFQYEESELIGQPSEVLLPARYRIRHIADREILFRSGFSGTRGADRELIALRKDGTECHVLVKLSMLTIAHVDWLICFFRDFSLMHDFEKKTHELHNKFQYMAWILQAQNSLPGKLIQEPSSLESFHERLASLSLGLPGKSEKKILVRELIDETHRLIRPHTERVAADLIVEEMCEDAWVLFSPSLFQMILLGFVKLCVESVTPLGERWVKIGLERQGNRLLITLTDSAFSVLDDKQLENAVEYLVGASLLQRYGGQLLTSPATHSRFCVSVPVQEGAS